MSDKKLRGFVTKNLPTQRAGGKTKDNKIEFHIKSDITIRLKYETWHLGKMIMDLDNSIQVPSAGFFKRQDDIHA
jgi:hypothetical protein